MTITTTIKNISGGELALDCLEKKMMPGDELTYKCSLADLYKRAPDLGLFALRGRVIIREVTEPAKVPAAIPEMPAAEELPQISPDEETKANDLETELDLTADSAETPPPAKEVGTETVLAEPQSVIEPAPEASADDTSMQKSKPKKNKKSKE